MLTERPIRNTDGEDLRIVYRIYDLMHDLGKMHVFIKFIYSLITLACVIHLGHWELL